MLPFCETWYCGISVWYWILLISGHVILYSTMANLYFLHYHYPFLDTLAQCFIITLFGSWLFTTWLPFFMILIRSERKEPVAAIFYSVGSILPFVFVLGSLIHSSAYPSGDDFYRHLLKEASARYTHVRNATGTYPEWLTYVQKEQACCGIQNSEDYSFLNHGYKIRFPCSCFDDVDHCGELTHLHQKGCLQFFEETRNYYLIAIWIYNTWILFGCIITVTIYLIGFRWVRNLDMVVLTGRVYVRTNENGLKSFPEIDSSEAISYSSSD